MSSSISEILKLFIKLAVVYYQVKKKIHSSSFFKQILKHPHELISFHNLSHIVKRIIFMLKKKLLGTKVDFYIPTLSSERKFK